MIVPDVSLPVYAYVNGDHFCDTIMGAYRHVSGLQENHHH